CPVAPLEAMACGTLTIVSALRCFDDYLKHEQTGMVFDHRVSSPSDSLATTLSRLLSDEELCRAIRARAHQQIEELSLTKVAGRYLMEFERLVAP
ncbi:MAG: glycosyltransferase, partial [Bdellovibrionales bacterium]|nr:glycosyltransferase [Bdellovibrionales bacterium]